MKKLALLPSLCALACAHAQTVATSEAIKPPPPPPPPDVDVSIIDPRVPACDDFFEHACKGWLDKTEIPADEAAWSRSFSEIHERNLALLRGYLEADAAGRGDTQDPYTDKLGNFWASCMDEAAVEKDSSAELAAALEPVEHVKDAASLAQVLAALQGEGVDAFFGFASGQDFKDATQVVGQLGQGGLGMPDRDYYLDQGDKKKALRDAYVKHVARMFALAGEPAPQAAADAAIVMRIETDLAKASQTLTARREPKNVYHRIDLGGVEKLAPDFPWTAWLAALGHAQIKAINVESPDFVKEIGAIVAGESSSDIRTYLRWHVIESIARGLSKAFVDEDFRMRQAFTGTAQILPRWKRCLAEIDGTIGQALARPFIRETFGVDGKERNVKRVEAIESAMHVELGKLAWMDAATRKSAEDKLALIANQIGYPDKWRDYSKLDIQRGSLIGNILRAQAFEVQRDLGKIGKPVDRSDWEMTPQTVNAYYDPSLNMMVFPAGILQPPFFNRASGEPSNYGSIGMVMGHELTHGFDDEGRQFDGHGNLTDWWSNASGAAFEERAKCVEKQAGDFVAIGDVHLNGKLTLGENLADLGGITLAFRAFEANKRAAKDIDGFTPEQQFFLSYAQSWCGKRRDDYERLMATVNPHSPPRFRVNGPLSNFDEFRKAFNCKPTDRMVRSGSEQCVVW